MEIEGFYIEMTSKDVTTHLHARAKWYDAEVEELGRRVRAKLEHDDRPQRRLSATAEGDGDILAVQATRDRAAELRFLAEHVVPDATYRLDAQDLEYLELIERAGLMPRRFRRVRVG